MAELINVKDWALSITNELSKISALETKEEVQSLLLKVADELEWFLQGFQDLQKDLTGAQMHRSIVRKYRRQIIVDDKTDLQVLHERYEEEKETAQEKALYTNLLNYMIGGYYLLNKIRDILMEPITYAIGFQDESGKMVYVQGLELEQLLGGAASLSSRVRLTTNNFARLEIDVKELIKDLTVTQADDDELYRDIVNYTEQHTLYKYTDRKGKQRGQKYSGGHLWEAYRYMKLYQIPFSEQSFLSAYEQARRGNLIYTKGGDVLAEQDKYGTSFALSSMATINTQIQEVIIALRQSSMEDVFTSLKSVFIQQVSDDVDITLQNYVNKDTEKLMSILKLK